MKKLSVLIAVCFMFIAGVALADDAELPIADPQGRGQLVSVDAATRGAMDVSKPINCHKDLPSGEAAGWMSSDENVMPIVEVGGKKYLLAKGVVKGQRYHPNQNGIYLKIEKAHPQAFSSGAKNPPLKMQDGNISYIGM